MLGEFNMQKIRKAVIPAAGYGTRFLPATKATPKEMLPIVDKPTIQYIVEEALASGIEEILIVSGHGKRAIEDHFDSAPTLEAELKKKGKLDLLKMVQDTANIRIHYIRQRYMRGLGEVPTSAGGKVTFTGQDPIVRSHFRIATCMAIPAMGAGVTAAAIWKDRTGQEQDLKVDLREASDASDHQAVAERLAALGG